MMKNFHVAVTVAAVGAATLLMAGSANAAIIYDTITGHTENAGVTGSATQRDSLRSVAAANRGPLGDAFTASVDEVLTSLTVRLRNVDPVGTNPDTGSVLLYLVPSTGSGATRLPATSVGTTLDMSSKILLGQINDSQVTAGGNAAPNSGAFANITINTSVSLIGGTAYWIEMVDAADPNNGNGGAPTSLKWGINSAVTATGVPTGANAIISMANTTNTGLVSFNSTNDVIEGTTAFPAGEVFELQLNAVVPEPTSLALLGASLLGLGFSRRRNKKTAA